MPVQQQQSAPAALGAWQVLAGVDAPLRCWWAPAGGSVDGRSSRSDQAVLVLPEVFGVNGWVRSVAERFAAAGVAALAMPLFARTAPDLELGYDAAALAEGRGHKAVSYTHLTLPTNREV